MIDDKKLAAIFEKHFREGMINKDFQAFKRTHPTLYKVILKTLIQVETANKKAKVTVPILPVDDAFERLANAIIEFKEANYYIDQIQIYCPEWYKKLMLKHASEYSFVSAAEPTKFMGVEFAYGYENALVVAPKKGYQNVLKWQPERIELILL